MTSRSPYQILGVDPQSSRDEIRRQYLARVRENPPETHPEEFEAIRSAYEALTSPTPTHPNTVASQSQEEWQAFDTEIVQLLKDGQWKRILSMIKDKPEPVRSLVRAVVYLNQERWDSHVRARDRALKLIYRDSPQLLAFTLRDFKRMYVEDLKPPRVEEALAIYDRYRQDPAVWVEIWSDYGDMLHGLGRQAELIPMMQPLLPGPDDSYDPEKCDVLIEWMGYLADNDLSGAAAQYRTLGLRIARQASPQDLMDMKESAEDLLEAALENENLRVAYFMADFVMRLDRSDKDAKLRAWDLQEAMAVQAELSRLLNDRRVYPLVVQDAWNLLATKMEWDEPGDGLYGDSLISLDSREAYVESVGRIKKSYPATFQMFRDDWEELVKKLTVGMNREQRRRLIR
ncbi:MAG: hypothetical protein C7B45_05880 [Sulfobacillus acidophilus]|uniref:J domain-containing protein n=1 Tax=Sulfobacillus acidophilus TaxID=53633 RepID=A0A2T2WKH2_9FIRM|nr:MAG: hypothetical protein C7B45_05880 [Sulfobacillus acidophilus]